MCAKAAARRVAVVVAGHWASRSGSEFDLHPKWLREREEEFAPEHLRIFGICVVYLLYDNKIPVKVTSRPIMAARRSFCFTPVV